MKNLKSLNLHRLGQAEMTRKEMNALTGGDGTYGPYDLPEVYICGCTCSCPSATCGCKYEGSQQGPDDAYYGGSSTTDNNSANQGGSKTSTHDSNERNAISK
ncbi:TIGR04149 family rSAM-modified RiPP [Bacteroides faecichinchillae]|uniref:TIGR04149 family rSAM-modified RiPP n=1 Tax=Bacteroides faecichinchillae TaxID=871325 RepID=UPI0035189255